MQKQKQILVFVLSCLFLAALLPQIAFCASLSESIPGANNLSEPQNFESVELQSNSVTFSIVDKDSIKNTFTVGMTGAKKIKDYSSIGKNNKKWDDVFDNVSIQYELSNNLLKETIFINSKSGKKTFDFTVLEMGGTRMELVDNTIHFVKIEGEYTLLECLEPYAIDANGVRYEYKYKLSGGNKIRISPAESLSGAAYPLRLDPTYTIQGDATSALTNSHRSLTRLGDGSYATVYLRTFDNDTVCMGVSEDLITWQEIKTFPDFGNASHPSIAVDRFDDLHLVWNGRYNDTRDDIYYAQYNGTWSTVNRITEDVVLKDFTSYYPAIAIDEYNQVHVVYTFTSVPIFVATWDTVGYLKRFSDGTWTNYGYDFLGGTQYPLENASRECAIAIADNNKIAIVYSCAAADDQTHHHIRYISSDSGGETWGTAESLSSGPFNNTQPSVAFDSSENVLVSWSGYVNLTERSIFFRQYTENTENWSAEFNVSHGGYDRCENLWQGNPSLSTAYDPAESSEIIFFVWNGYSTLFPDNELAILYRFKVIDDDWWYTSTGYSVHVADSNETYPSALWSIWPRKCGTSVNIPRLWHAFAYHHNDDANVFTKPAEWNAFAGSDLIVIVLDAKTGSSVRNYSCLLSSGTSDDSTTGESFFPCEETFTSISLTVTAIGYSPSAGEYTIYLDGDKSITISLMPIEDDEYFQPAQPMPVEFRVQTWSGTPISDVNVTAIGVSTTMGSWTWLWEVLTFSSGTAIHNTSMSDTTDSIGSITFLMVPSVKYEITLIKAPDINETVFISPKEEHYKIIVGEAGYVDMTSMWDVINYSITANELNDTHYYINFSYEDLGNQTSELYYYLNLTNGTSPSSNIYNHTYDISNSSSISNSQIVARGPAYLIGFEADNDGFGTIRYSFALRIFLPDTRLFELGIPDYLYDYICLGLLFLLAAFFGVLSVPQGAMVICLCSWGLWFCGWLCFGVVLMPLYLMVATVLAILIVFSAGGRQRGVS